VAQSLFISARSVKLTLPFHFISNNMEATISLSSSSSSN